MTGRERIKALIKGQHPDKIIYSPNIWQWFNHHKSHNTLPKELENCETLIDAHLILGEDCFSRNLVTEQRTQWYGGFAEVSYSGIDIERVEKDSTWKIVYHTNKGSLEESFLYDRKGSTLIQLSFLLDNPVNQLPAFKELLMSRRISFNKKKMGFAGKQHRRFGRKYFW